MTTFSLGNQNEANALFLSADVNDDNVINDKDLPGIFTFFDKDCKKRKLTVTIDNIIVNMQF